MIITPQVSRPVVLFPFNPSKMSENQESLNFFQKYFRKLLAYLKVRSELAYVILIEKFSLLLAFLLSALVIFFFLCLFFLFFSLLAAFYLSEVSGSMLTGFGLVTLFYMLVFILLAVFNKTLIRRPIMSAIIRILFETIEKPDHDGSKKY